jgi:hypothetical protein
LPPPLKKDKEEEKLFLLETKWITPQNSAYAGEVGLDNVIWQHVY